MENACFGVFELHIQVAITYQGKIRLIFSLIVWFLVCFRPFSRLVAWLCVCVWGARSGGEGGRGCEVVLSPYVYVSANSCTPLCLLRARVCGLGVLVYALGCPRRGRLVISGGLRSVPRAHKASKKHWRFTKNVRYWKIDFLVVPWMDVRKRWR